MNQKELRRVYSRLAQGAETPAPAPAPSEESLLADLLAEQRRTNEHLARQRKVEQSKASNHAVATVLLSLILIVGIVLALAFLAPYVIG